MTWIIIILVVVVTLLMLRLYKKSERVERDLENTRACYYLMKDWVKIKQDGNSLSEWLKQRGYKKIALYGMNYITGQIFCDELENTDVEILYGIDRSPEAVFSDLPVFSIDHTLDAVDAVVVIAFTHFDEVKDMLEKKMGCPVVSLKELIESYYK